MKHSAMVCRRGFPFNYDQEAVSIESGLKCEDGSKTLQSQKEDADINVIVKRFGVTGMLPQSLKLPTFQDFEGIFDFRTAMDAVKAAEAAFMGVPADIRRRFGNDPQEFVAFCSEPKNLDELRKLGLAPAAADPSADLVKEVEREEAKDKIRASRKPPEKGGDKA